jgi:hypothetical protein
MVLIKIETDFTDHPGGRNYTDGPFSGEEFRDRFLTPNMKAQTPICINFDGTWGCGKSFLEESFGGLARIFGIDRVLESISFVSDEDPELIERAKLYIKECNTPNHR